MSYSPILYQNDSNKFKLTSPPHRIPLSGMCLTKFDVKRGNTLVWSATVSPDVNLLNIEFKTLPSGIHEQEKDWISFVIPKSNGEFYYGIALFSQNGIKLAGEEVTGHIDRKKVSMYSLAVIVDPELDPHGGEDYGYYNLKSNAYISANEYMDDMEVLIEQYLESESENEILERFFNSNKLVCAQGVPFTNPAGKLVTDHMPYLSERSRRTSGLSKEDNIPSATHSSWLHRIPEFFKRLGPLMFTLWKSCLLRERILIVHNRGDSFENTNALVYCLSILSYVPRGLGDDDDKSEYLQTLYTIGVTDLEYLTGLVSNALSSASVDKYDLPSFIACTSDEVLAQRSELFDLVLNLSVDTGIEVLKYDQLIKATPTDWAAFRYLSELYLDYEFNDEEISNYLTNVEPLSWSQYLIDAFCWWATAGYFQPSYYSFDAVRICDPIIEKSELETVIGLLENFHDRTNLLYNTLQGFTRADSSDEEDSLLVMSPFFLSKCGLDCFSSQDYQLVRYLCEKWFNKMVEIRLLHFRPAC
ncbi:HCL496Wp [Eremothecium sinecaudum]|uniref:HCL496Wp n=1 Tax=Eremothecium sinecaudum TaxID=45286 RepID=A0A109UY52_9SACH|nr:HCL496Wp [Eremothecium sinecaudum]AMD19655.1 HCL496Wp [Eremothecium sinecaudum]